MSKLPRSKEVQSWSLKSMAAHTDDAKDKFHQRSLYDGIIYDDTHFDRLEFGIFEVAKDFNSLTETKIVHDRQKLYRGMHGMGRLISKAVDYDSEAMKSIQVIGVQNMGKLPRSLQPIFPVPNLLNVEFSFRIQVGTPISPDEIIISQGDVQTIPATFDKLQTILLVLKSVGFVMVGVLLLLLLKLPLTIHRKSWIDLRRLSKSVSIVLPFTSQNYLRRNY